MACSVVDDGFGGRRFRAEVVGNAQCQVYLKFIPASDQTTQTYTVSYYNIVKTIQTYTVSYYNIVKTMCDR